MEVACEYNVCRRDGPHHILPYDLLDTVRTLTLTVNHNLLRQKLHANTIRPECRLRGTGAARILWAACCADAGLRGGREGVDMGTGFTWQRPHRNLCCSVSKKPTQGRWCHSEQVEHRTVGMDSFSVGVFNLEKQEDRHGITNRSFHICS